MAKGNRRIEPWEAALIKAMLAAGTFNRDQIIAYFSRPERPVNPARINEIAKGVIHADVQPANAAQISALLRTFRSPKDAQRSFFDENPLHPVNLQSGMAHQGRDYGHLVHRRKRPCRMQRISEFR